MDKLKYKEIYPPFLNKIGNNNHIPFVKQEDKSELWDVIRKKSESLTKLRGDNTINNLTNLFNNKINPINNKTNSHINNKNISDLPIKKYKNKIMRIINEHQITIIVGDTGCGKSTQIPQYLASYGPICCTQPRRIAATSLAYQLSRECSFSVGYKIRFDDTTSHNTRIKFVTEGILLKELISNKLIPQYSVVIVDEAHERSINIDLILGLLKQTLRNRRDLKLVITSATIDANKFSQYFNDAPIVYVEGRRYPVTIQYLAVPVDDYAYRIVKQICYIYRNLEPGNILVFVPGRSDIEGIIKLLLREKLENLCVYALHSQIPVEEQQNIFNNEIRKCIISTNIAETSLTIKNIKYVIDSGMTKIKMYRPVIGMDSLVTVPVSRSNARQRAGRAGRTEPGIVYRMYTRGGYDELVDEHPPEIQRINVNAVVLMLCMIFRDSPECILQLDLLDKPSKSSILNAFTLLWKIGALDDNGKLTQNGDLIGNFPLEPTLANMLLKSLKYGCTKEIINIISMLSVEGIFKKRNNFKNTTDHLVMDDNTHGDYNIYTNNNICSDHLLLLNIIEEYLKVSSKDLWCKEKNINYDTMKKVEMIRKQLISLLRKYKIKSNRKNVITCIIESFHFNIARRWGKNEYLIMNSFVEARIHPTSCLAHRVDLPEYVIFNQFIYTKCGYLVCVSAVDPEMVRNVAPRFYGEVNNKNLNSKKIEDKKTKIDEFNIDELKNENIDDLFETEDDIVVVNKKKRRAMI